MSYQSAYLSSSTNSKQFCTTSPFCSCDMLVLVAGTLPLRSAESCWVSHAWSVWIRKQLGPETIQNTSSSLVHVWPRSRIDCFFRFSGICVFYCGKRSRGLHLAVCRIGSLLWVPFTKPAVACQVLRHWTFLRSEELKKCQNSVHGAFRKIMGYAKNYPKPEAIMLIKHAEHHWTSVPYEMRGTPVN